MPTTENENTERIAERRRAAEAALCDAQQAADAVRVEHAVAVLHDAFPQHTLAIYLRNWDQDQPHLAQLLTPVDGVKDVEVEDDFSELPTKQQRAITTADEAIRLIGSDEDIADYLNLADERHPDWVEFQLPLTTDAG